MKYPSVIQKLTKNKGFTLVEVLITIAIIGVLFSITSYVFGIAEARSRDQKRLTDLATIDNALEQYHLDNRKYPQAGQNTNNVFAAKFQLERASDCTFTTAGKAFLAPTYLASIPEDPQYRLNLTGSGSSCNSNQYGQYLYVTVTTDPNSPAQAFYLMARAERQNNISQTAPTQTDLGFFGSVIYGGSSNLILCDQTTNPAQLVNCTQTYYRQNSTN